MIATALSLRDFRSYEAAEVRLGAGLTVVSGRNGAGKTNLLEALYFACTGHSCRTANEREVVRFGAGVARLELDAERDGDAHRITVGFEPGEAKRLQVDGATVDKLTDAAARPFRVDEWLLYSCDSPTAQGARGLARGMIYSLDGRLIASTAQEGLIRLRDESGDGV